MENDQRVVAEVSRRSGLKESTVRELLSAGYSYVERVREPSKWIYEGDKPRAKRTS